jgi:RNA polymerase sigma-70 factor, ECF subfamily
MAKQRSREDRDPALSLDAARIDADRLARFRAGDAAAFDEVLSEYWDPVVRYAEGMLADRDVAHDVAQEVFIRLWLKRHEWTRSAAIPAFLYRVAHNLVVDEHRKTHVRARGAVARHTRQDYARSPVTPATELDQAYLRDTLDRAVAALSERRREVFVLYHFHNRSYRQIAEILGVKPQVVANYMSAALTELRRTLKPLLSELIE